MNFNAIKVYSGFFLKYDLPQVICNSSLGWVGRCPEPQFGNPSCNLFNSSLLKLWRARPGLMENVRDPHACPLDFYHVAGNDQCFALRSSHSNFGLVSASLSFLFLGQGPSKKAAKHKAAEVALRLLKGGNMLEPTPLDEARWGTCLLGIVLEIPDAL